MAELTLRVITPDQIVLDQPVSSVVVPAIDGLLGILPRHAPLVAALDVGTLSYREGGVEKALFVSGGFAEVRGGTVRIVSEAGEQPGKIDPERARAAETRASERLTQAREGGEIPPIDLARASAALRRAQMRLRIHGRTRS